MTLTTEQIQQLKEILKGLERHNRVNLTDIPLLLQVISDRLREIEKDEYPLTVVVGE